jgi:hypothetical protein
MHQALRKYRFERKCGDCGRVHKEIFDVDGLDLRVKEALKEEARRLGKIFA